jgi:hypothetical protein
MHAGSGSQPVTLLGKPIGDMDAHGKWGILPREGNLKFNTYKFHPMLVKKKIMTAPPSLTIFVMQIVKRK